MCATFQAKQTTLTFSVQISPKMGFGVRILKICVWARNQHLQDTMYANFQSK